MLAMEAFVAMLTETVKEEPMVLDPQIRYGVWCMLHNPPALVPRTTLTTAAPNKASNTRPVTVPKRRRYNATTRPPTMNPWHHGARTRPYFVESTRYHTNSAINTHQHRDSAPRARRARHDHHAAAAAALRRRRPPPPDLLAPHAVQGTGWCSRWSVSWF